MRNSKPMWELNLVTDHATCDLLLSEREGRQVIKDWADWSAKTAEEWDEAESMGSTFRDKEAILVRIIEGWYEVEIEEPTETTPGRYALAKTVVAYKFDDIVAMSTKYKGDYGLPEDSSDHVDPDDGE